MSDASGRFWAGEAKAAYDQAITEAGMQRDFVPTPDFWVARAQAAAAIESAEQARAANLIAWKALQAQRAGMPAGDLSAGGGDAVTEEIETLIGVAP